MKISKLETIGRLDIGTKWTSVRQGVKLVIKRLQDLGFISLLFSQKFASNNLFFRKIAVAILRPCNKLLKYFLYSIFSFFLLFNSNIALSKWGDVCVSVTPIDDFLQESAYGHLKNKIDMHYSVTCCDAQDPHFKFCLNDNIVEEKAAADTCKTEIILNNGDSKKISDLSKKNPNLGGNPWLKDIVLTVKKIDTYLCLTMPTSRGPIPLACKNTTIISPISPEDQCRTIGKTCYMGTTKSQSLFNFSGLAIECLKETLDKVFYQYRDCVPTKEKISFAALNPFPVFQESLKVAIRGGLIIYVIIFGFNLVLNKDYGSLDKVVTSVFKILLVLYFAVGLGPVYFKNGKETTQNGMMEYGLPLLTGMTASFAQIVFNAGGSKGLCEFDIGKYDAGYQFYAVWDAIDCRIGYYLGMGLMYNIENKIYGEYELDSSKLNTNTIGEAVKFSTPGSSSPDALSKVGSLQFFTVLFGFLMSGNIIIVISGLIFVILFCSIVLHFITSYLVCLITIYVMTYISPIFIPMVLFNRTKAYFDAWLKICLSCALQPAVIAGFIALLLTLYDSAIYKNCQFIRHNYMYTDGTKFNTFELIIPNNDNDPSKLDKDPSKHVEERCISSAGYKLMKYYGGEGWKEHLVILFPIKSIVIDIFKLLEDMLYVFVFSMIFYFFSKSISQFAAEITGGPIMDSVTASPTKLVNMAIKAAEFIKDASQVAGGGKPGQEGGDPTDKLRKGIEKGEEGSGESKDSAGGGEGQKEGGGGGEAKDLIGGGG